MRESNSQKTDLQSVALATQPTTLYSGRSPVNRTQSIAECKTTAVPSGPRPIIQKLLIGSPFNTFTDKSACTSYRKSSNFLITSLSDSNASTPAEISLSSQKTSI